MTWTEVADRLAEARTYWLGSTTASGAPHAAPVWGVVTGEDALPIQRAEYGEGAQPRGRPAGRRPPGER